MAEDPTSAPAPDPTPTPVPTPDPVPSTGFTQAQVNAFVAAERKKAEEKLQDEIKARQQAEQNLAAEAEARQEAEDALRVQEAAGLKMQVGMELGLPPEIVDRLQGNDEAALRKDGESLKDLLKEGKGYAGPGIRPPKTEPEQDMSALIRRKAGRG
jgi:hypothetical protein